MGEIDMRICSLEGQPADDDLADRLPAVASGPPVSKLGDLWRLDHHRVFCGDALDRAAFAALMGEERSAVVFTDRPTTCRSMVTPVVSARSIIARSRWHRARW